jgi:hypothetical protein
MDHRRLAFPERKPKRSSLRDLLRDPLRATLLGALVVMVIGTLRPWIHGWLPGIGDFTVSGFERAGDAAIILELGIVGVVLTGSDRAWNSRITPLVVGPLVIAVGCLLIVRIAWVEATEYLDSLNPRGGHGEILPWFWMTGLGAAVGTLAGAIAVWRARGRLSFNPGLTPSAVAAAVGAVAGAVFGFIAGTRIAELLTAGSIAGVASSVIVIVAVALAFLGAWVGAVGAASLARPSRRQ